METKFPQALVEAVLDKGIVTEHPHDVYKYPARFSPKFAREAIQAFTKRGDLVFDPFCGGGTSVVEAVALGRKAVGCDINTLATFLARVKVSAISVHDKWHILAWLSIIEREPITKDQTSIGDLGEQAEYYTRNLPDEALIFFSWVIGCISRLPTTRQQNFVRFILLSVGQNALDCRNYIPTQEFLKSAFCARLRGTLDNFLDFLTLTASANEVPRCRISQFRRVFCRSSEGVDQDGRIPNSWLPAKLVLTSPPYPGVHVLYHRWQILGRREAPAPYWLADQRDGAGLSYYTLGDRQRKNSVYFAHLESVYRSVRNLMDRQSLMLQLVAFSEPRTQLPLYLATMERAGFTEVPNRIWRSVPSRKWYAERLGEIGASQEVMLAHRISR
jgi:DNA modification methylase